jgi:hypothetical protein
MVVKSSVPDLGSRKGVARNDDRVDADSLEGFT